MDKLLYLASSSGKEIMRAQAINSNNLANANTTGFRQDFAFARSLAVQGAGADSRVYSQTRGQASDMSAGVVKTTGRELDMAIRGDGWFAVQGDDGTEGYTRAGDLRITPGGMLTTGAGLPVLGNEGGPIVIPPADKIELGTDGTISILPRGQDPNTMVVVDRIKMVNPDMTQMKKGNDGLFRMANGEPVAPDAGVQLISGALETSNVNPVDSMLKMMELGRKFELQVKMMEKANEMDNASMALMRMS